MDEGWAACAPRPGPHPHGRDPAVDPRARQKRQRVPGPFRIGQNKTSVYHHLGDDGRVAPVIDDVLFPDMAGLVAKIHEMGLEAGWYLNDCLSYCYQLGDPCDDDRCFDGDVKAWFDNGFDNVKIDGCSQQRNISKWAKLINATGRKARIENCNNGPAPTLPLAEGGCPDFHQYRTSGDIRNTYESWVYNAQVRAMTISTFFFVRSLSTGWRLCSKHERSIVDAPSDPSLCILPTNFHTHARPSFPRVLADGCGFCDVRAEWTWVLGISRHAHDWRCRGDSRREPS